jgi:hypothetical protein
MKIWVGQTISEIGSRITVLEHSKEREICVR